MAHRAETLRSIHRAMSECPLATSYQSLIPLKKIFLLYNKYRIGIVYPFLKKQTVFCVPPFFRWRILP